MTRLWIAAAMAMILMGCSDTTNIYKLMTPHNADSEISEGTFYRDASGRADTNRDGLVNNADDLNGDGRINELDEMLASDGVYIEPEQPTDDIPSVELPPAEVLDIFSILLGGEAEEKNANQFLTALHIIQSIRDLEGSELLLTILSSEVQAATKLEQILRAPSSPAKTQLLEALSSDWVYFLEVAVQLGLLDLDGK